MLRAKKAKYNTFTNHYSSNISYDTIKSDEQINIYSNTEKEMMYIQNLKTGQFINFSEKQGKKIIYQTGRVNRIYTDKFCLTIKIGERIVTKMVTVNDLVQKSFEVINK